MPSEHSRERRSGVRMIKRLNENACHQYWKEEDTMKANPLISYSGIMDSKEITLN